MAYHDTISEVVAKTKHVWNYNGKGQMYFTDLMHYF